MIAARLGIYVHLPYCTSLCPYCDFNSYVQPRAPWQALEQALVDELTTRAPLFHNATPAQTLYFGGGTVQATGTFMGNTLATGDPTLDPNTGTITNKVTATHTVVGLSLHNENLFGAAEVDRYQDAVYSLKLGLRF